MTFSVKPRRDFVMVRIPAGEFLMGSSYGHGDVDEFPVHKVWVDEFLIGQYLVTAAEWARFLNDVGGDTSRYFEASRETTVILKQGNFYPRQECFRPSCQRGDLARGRSILPLVV